VVNVIPSVFLFAPDDASAFIVLPATKYLLRGRGREAALLVGAGSLGALVTLALLAPLLDELLRPLRTILQPHLGWILVAIVAFLILSEWPRNDDRAPTPLRRLLSAWTYLGAGLLTFVLSGLLGFVLLYRSPIPVQASFANLLPAFAGLFAAPGLLQMLLFGVRPPAQHMDRFDLPPYAFVRGTLTGVAGGLFSGLLPIISGSVGGLLAGHATAQRDERAFLVSQGASKVAYYAGGLLLLFVPGLTLTRGGMAWLLTTVYVPSGWRLYWLAVAAVALCGALAFALLVLFAHGAAAITGRLNHKIVAALSLAVAAGITFAFTGANGLLVMAVATCVGLIPLLIGGRRMDCLGVLLLPMTLNMIGVGPTVAAWLGLL
ncbi:MAG: tripartite tricarboxylate transporter permease, partial [Chloroflexi bacterium]|nr:tripartite tricarboxylate transporter permease [Chloroflexota bacterium]